jgi:glycosyltransferase involved in cell wall biosynthesis
VTRNAPAAPQTPAHATAGATAVRPTIAFITTCKNRLHHLKETLPLMAANAPDELIVVDYSCPELTGDWVEANFPQAKVVRVTGQDGFNPSRARNAGAAAATSEWLFFIDADIRAMPRLLEAVRANLQPGVYFRPQYKLGLNAEQAYGTFCVRAEDFAAVEGFDEVLDGWGYEDQDLYERLTPRLTEMRYSIHLLKVIAHEDDERHIRTDMRDRWENEAINSCYGEAKRAISLHRGGIGNLPLQEREGIMRNVRKIVSAWYAKGATDVLPVRFMIRQNRPHKLAAQMWVRAETVVTVFVSPRMARDAMPASFRPAELANAPKATQQGKPGNG